MYKEIIEGIKKYISSQELDIIEKSNLHLAVFTEPCLTYMLEGKKTIESRFSKRCIMPFSKVKTNDIVFVKKSGGPVVAYLKLKRVEYFDLNYYDIEKIKNEYNDYLCVDDKFWETKKTSKYATLMFIKEVVILSPFKVTKRGMNTWMQIKKD